MGGGLMQLVAYGAQDIYLTGNPQITFFKVVYRRHTNFSMEDIQQTLNGTASNNGTQTCTISRNGDLVHKVWIEYEDSGENWDYGSVYDVLKNVDCEIGGQLIDRQHNDWNAIWWNLTTPESKVEAVRNNFVSLSGADSSKICYVPLNFWFCRNPGLALPLIALQYHEVKLKIVWGTIANFTPKVWIKYIYLDTDERRRFAQVSHEYLIEQVQRQTFDTNSKKNFKLNFNHPVKELIWVNDVDGSDGNNTSFAPIRCDDVTISVNSTQSAYNNADNTKIKLQLNGHNRFSERYVKYFKTCQVLENHTRCPSLGKRFTVTASIDDNIGDMGLLLYLTYRPVRLIKADVSISVADTGGSLNYFMLYSGKISSSDMDFTDGSSTNQPMCSVGVSNAFGQQTFTLDPDKAKIVGQSYIGISGAENEDGGSTAAVDNAKGNITLEFEELPLLIGGNGLTDLANIYCYSFALKPEEHQPSGTCNFSRIDNAQLMFDDTLANSTLKVFAVNYNVLRIMSGMGGLAYSN